MAHAPRLLLLSLLACSAGACQDNVDMVTAALDTASEVGSESLSGTGMETGTDGGGSMSGGTGSASGTGTATVSTSDDPTSETTTSEPVPCDTAPDCTAPGDPDGDPGPTLVPYFRGRACVPKAVKPGQPLPIRLEACLHPCLKVNAFAYKHTFRCPEGACEAAATLFYRDVVGVGCPSDVFAKFDPSQCAYTSPIDIIAGPLSFGGADYEGVASVLIPYLSNEQGAEIDGGADTSEEIWKRIDANTQDPSRSLEVSVVADAPDAPAVCDDADLCVCSDVGF